MIAFSLLILAFLLAFAISIFVVWLLLVNKYRMNDAMLFILFLVSLMIFGPLFAALGNEVYKKANELDQRISVKE